MMKKREKSFSVFTRFSVLALGVFKVISTIIFITSYKLHDFLYPFNAFAVPLCCAAFYDTELVENYGKAMLVSFFALLLVWILLLILLLFKNPVVVKIGYVLFIIVNCVDIACVVWSLIHATFMMAKILNLLFSVLLIAFTIVAFARQRKSVDE